MAHPAVQRFLPEGYPLAEDVFAHFAFQQCVRAGDQLHISGVTPLRGELAGVKLVGEGDLRTQLAFCFAALDQCLAACALRVENVVSVTVYATDIDALAAQADMFRAYFGDYPPAATWLEVRRLFHPGQMVEIAAIAAG